MKKKRIAVILIAALILTSICRVNMVSVQAAKKTVKVGKGFYTVTSEQKKTARFDKVAKKSVTSLTIPATVKIGKKTYKVTEIKANALKGNKKISKLIIGKNIKKIGSKAFYGCKNLKSVTIKTTKLTTKSVGINAFKGLNDEVQIEVPKSKIAAYRKILKARGVNGKGQVITSGKTTTEEKKEEEKKPTVIPDPEVRFAIGEPKFNRIDKNYWADTKTEAEYEVGKNIRFSMSLAMPQEIYGSWSVTKTTTTFSIRCGCQKWFDNTDDYAVHCGQTGHGSYWYFNSKQTIDVWHWTLDDTPCKVVYHATLPSGLTVNPNSIEVWRRNDAQINSSEGKYTVQISNQELIVTINDIKPEPYRSLGVIVPIVVKFTAGLNESADAVNQINAGITYNYGKGDKTVNMNSVTIRKK